MSNALAVETLTHETYVVDGKEYKTEEAAEAALAALANVQLGYEFAEAQFPELKPRGLRTKANLIGEYLDWIDAGKPELTEDERADRIAKAEARDAAKAEG